MYRKIHIWEYISPYNTWHCSAYVISVKVVLSCIKLCHSSLFLLNHILLHEYVTFFGSFSFDMNFTYSEI